MNFANLKVRTRLSLGFGLLLVLIAIIITVGINRMVEINRQLNSIANVNNAEARWVTQMRAAVYEQSLIIRNIALTSDAAASTQHARQLKEQMGIYSDAEKALDHMFVTLEETQDTEKAAMANVKDQAAKIAPLLGQIVEMTIAGRNEDVETLLAGDLPAWQAKRRDTLLELAKLEDFLNDNAVRDAYTAYRQAVILMLSVGALTLLVGILACFLITRSLIKQLGGEPVYAVAIAKKIAAGDLTVSVEIKDHDRSSLLFAMKSMSDSLLQIVRQVRSGTDAIVTASGEIASGNLDLSSRTEQQAGSLEETASAMEELTSTVKQNADNARQANQLAASAATVAVEGGETVRQVINTMTSIHDSSRKIVDIISVIDGIAFQTNILALNAAVEAARAGEQGRGFAVVASEVRSLAQRSAAAAKEIKSLIDDSVEKVASGSKLVGQAGETMDEVVNSVKRVTDVMADITAASQEQSIGIEEVNQAIVQMDEVTQQNAALVEQAAAAAQSLQDQATTLAKTVGIFKIHQQLAGHAAQSLGIVARKSPATLRLGIARVE